MSGVKNFGTAGVGADLQYGKGGNRVVSSAGAFLLLNAAGSPVRLSIANAVSAGDAVNFSQLSANISAVNASIASINSNATTLAGTVSSLSTTVSQATANISTQAGQISALQSNTANNASAISSLQSNAAAATASATTISNVNTSVGLKTDGTFQTITGTSYLGSSTTIVGALQTLDSTLSGLSTSTASNAVAQQSAITSLQSALSSEVSRATAAETSTNSNVSALAAQVTGLGNVFNYKGKLDGTNLNLDTADSNPHIGDYFKVGVGGTYTFTDSGSVARTIVVNANDGLVKSSTGWDKIDNTDSTVAGTANLIAVSGSADTGYTVTVDPAFVSRVSTLETNLPATTATLRGEISSNATTVTGLVTTETNRAKAAETSLSSNTSAVAAGVGLAANGSYVANSTSHYMTSATTVFDASNKLDTALYNVSQALASLSQSTIKSASGLYQVQTTNTDIELFGNVGGTSTQFVNFVTGSAQNATVTLSTVTAGEIRLEAHSGSISNVDIHLVPLGTGVINVSTARVTNVANASAAGDATNLGQLNTVATNAAAATTAAQVGAVRTVTGSVGSSSGTVNLGSAIKGTVKRILVQVTAAYAGGSQITVGDVNLASSLAVATDIDEGTIGLYVIETLTAYGTSTQLTATVSSGGGTGAATIIIDYVQA